MANSLTLLDLAKFKYSDATIGLIEEILIIAPELNTLPVVPKPGTSYMFTRRTGLPRGAFRLPYEGIDPSKSTFEQITVPMYFYDGQMIIDEQIVKADERRLGDILAIEGAGQVKDNAAVMGRQIYAGTAANAKGFKGLKEQVLPAMIVDAGGAGATTETVWFVYENERDGLYLPIGNRGSLDMAEWQKQQVNDDTTPTKKYMAWVNNLSFFIGLAIGATKAIGCIKNVTAAKPVTDMLGEQLYAQFDVGRKPTRCFMSRNSRFYLQTSRVTPEVRYPQRPTDIAGVPIVETDNILTIAAW